MVMRARNLWGVALGGASAFWTANLLISLTPLAAEYRAALSIHYPSMLIEAAVGGILSGLVVSWVLLTFPDSVPGRTPMAKSLVLSLIFLVAVTALLEAPAKFSSSLTDPWRYFFIALVFNALRIPGLGLAIGYLANRSLTR